MALKGTLKDFGIADIFQLISHQSKTGVLHLHSRDQEVRISFVNGDVVHAESATRKKHDLLGSMLVRAEVITREQLDESLDIQKRTLKRLGHVLVERGVLTVGELREFTHLQTTETIFKLFNWESGTYAFEVEEVSYDQDTIEPIRSENILMEGFRMVDEWPMIRKKISSYTMVFKKVKELPEGLVPKDADEEIDDALDDMFTEEPKSKGPKNIGANEARVYVLVNEERDVQKLIDLSRLGEFETCKALFNLLTEGYIKIDTSRRVVEEAVEIEGKPGGRLRRIPLGRILIQTLMYAFIAAVVFVLYNTLDVDVFSLVENTGTRRFQSPVAREVVGSSQLRRLDAALEVYRLERGSYPVSLDELVRAKLVDSKELRFPWRNRHVYRRQDGHYVLLRPLD